jgi:uncharacterized protein (TIGR03435 family)
VVTDVPGLSTALKDLGLNLAKYAGAVETIVADHVEENPTDN